MRALQQKFFQWAGEKKNENKEMTSIFIWNIHTQLMNFEFSFKATESQVF